MPRLRTLSATLFAALLLTALPASADEPSFEFEFPNELSLVPSSIPLHEVITMAAVRSGDTTEVTVLLRGGRLLTFNRIESHPLSSPQPDDAVVALGK